MEYEESAKLFKAEDEDQDLWFLLTHTRYAIFRARELELQRYGLTPEQVSLLFVVQALGSKATPAELARTLLRRPHTMCDLVTRMETKGMVKKIKDLDRKNLIRVAITQNGKKAYAQSAKIPQISGNHLCQSQARDRLGSGKASFIGITTGIV